MSKVAAKTLADFRAAHDRDVIIPNKIKVALTAMLKEGPEHYEYEQDFMKRAGIGQTDISDFRDQFAQHIVVTPAHRSIRPKNVWFADPKVARRARGGDAE